MACRIGCGPATNHTQSLTHCDMYCDLALANCINGDTIYRTLDSCIQACQLFPSNGEDGDISGNTVQCRITYLIAANQNPLVFCLNATLSSGTACK